MFNTAIDRAEDVSGAIAQEILRRLNLEDRDVPQIWRASWIATSARIVS